MDFSEVVRRRRMVRNYLPDPLPEDRLARVMDLARHAPSAGFSQGQSFVVVRDAATRERIADIADEASYAGRGFEPWLSRAPVQVVCCVSKEAYLTRYREADKAKAGRPESWPVPFWFVDGGSALMLLLLAAVDEGWAAGFLALKARGFDQIRDLLGIPPEVTPFGLVTLGMPAPDRRSGSLKRGWKPVDEVIHWETWGGQG